MEEEVSWAEIKATLAQTARLQKELREEEAKRREAEAKRREEEAKRREAEAKRREAEAKQREAEAKRREAEAKRREEEEARRAKRREEEEAKLAKRREEEEARRAKRRKEEEAKQAEWQKEANLRSNMLDERLNELGAYTRSLAVSIGGINENLGNHAEQFFQDIFSDEPVFGGEKYDRMIPNLLCTSKKNIIAEFDIILENCKSVAVIEVKNRIHPNFVKEFAEERIVKFRKYFPLYKKHKIYLGIAGFSFSKAVLAKAKEYGIGIVRQVGKSVEVDTQNLKAY